MVRSKTGLVLDPYFSATKIQWLLREVPGLRQRAERGEILFGTVDSWLIYNLTGRRLHATDPSNAARTLLYNIHSREWDDELLDLFTVPRAMLPEVRPSSGDFGALSEGLLGAPIPIRGVAGDQQAALFGQGCVSPGEVKTTYGTGCFLLMHTGARPLSSRHGLLTTIAWEIAGETEYALEGSVFVAGAAIQWLRDELGLLSDAQESEALAQSVEDTGGVYLVPAFTGLGAPHWDEGARGTVVGLTRGSGRAHLVRAALESIAYQTEDVLQAMRRDTGMDIPLLRVDGGAARNDFLLQFQADISGTQVVRGEVTETTALGAALLAGLASGIYRDRSEMRDVFRAARRFEPAMAQEKRQRLLSDWHRAVERARGWVPGS